MENIKKLGFGLMRLPMKNNEIDIEQTKKMADEFLAAGFTYFDTAYVYIGGNSERAVKEVLVDRYPRESFQLATKLPIWCVSKAEDMERVFSEQLERTGAGYFDYYLLHSLQGENIKALDKFGAWDFVQRKKEEGKIKKWGFSFHDSAEKLDELLTAHPDAEFVQLQINYLDWDSKRVQAEQCYKTAVKHNKQIIIMEPVKGGALASLPEDAEKLLKAADPDASFASWAIRFAASLPNVMTVLSGMSNEEQALDNISYMKDFKPLTEEETDMLFKAAKIIRAIPTVKCTDCKYCVDGCPKKINIPALFKVQNNFLKFPLRERAEAEYKRAINERGAAKDCIGCKKCERVCPQHLEITSHLKEISKNFDASDE